MPHLTPTPSLTKLGFRQCSAHHFQATIDGEVLDFWPSTRKWRYLGETYRGTQRELRTFIEDAPRALQTQALIKAVQSPAKRTKEVRLKHSKDSGVMETLTEGLGICPKCGAHGVYVKDSRPTVAGRKRRRACPTCRHVYSTYEITAESYATYTASLKALRTLHKTLEKLLPPEKST